VSNENYDSTWYPYEKYGREEEVLRYGEKNINVPGNWTYSAAHTDLFRTYTNFVMYSPAEKGRFSTGPKPPFPGGKTSDTEKENPAMGSNYGLSYDDQHQIDEEVREAIAAPKRAAEVANRKAAVEALGVEDTYEVGTVLTFDRAASKTVTHSHVALKTDAETWLATGGRLTGNGSQSWNGLLTWMTTGDVLVSNVAISTPASRTPITWTPASVVPAQSAPADEKV